MKKYFILEINDVFSLLTPVKFANVETRKKRTFQINGSNLFCFLLNDWISSPVISVRCGSALENKIFRNILQREMISSVDVTEIKQ